MAGYLGNTPIENYSTAARQAFSSPTGTGFTLSKSVSSSNDIALFVNNIRQEPTTYTAAGTALTLTEALVSGDTMWCMFYGQATHTVNPPDGSVGTAKVSDNAITLAKMAGGTDGQIITYDASGDPVAVGPGTDGQVLTSTGAGSPPAFETISAGLTLATKQATTSGSSVTFSGIPSGTSLIFVNFDGVSLSGSSDNLLIRLGDAGGIETSGYISTSTKIISGAHPSADTSSAGFLIRLIDDGLVTSGQMILTLFDAATFTWVQSHTVLGSIYQPMIGGGKKALSAELTQLSLLTTGSDTFDAGSINISYQ